jgi:hypothetical protein
MPFHNIPPHKTVKSLAQVGGISPPEQANIPPLGLSIVHICASEETSHSLKGEFTIWEGGTAMDLKLRLMGKQASKQAVPKRGTIKGFSPKARKRMIRSVVKMDQEAMGKPLFLTLTYPGEFSDNPLVFKRHLHNFMTELRRRWPAAAIQWRL